MEASASRKASRVSRTSPELSSTNSTSVATWCPPTVFANQLQSPEQQRQRLNSPGRLAGINVRENLAAILCSRDVALLRQSHSSQPEFVNALHQIFERVQLHWLGQVAIRLQLIAFGNVRLRLRSRQDNGGNRSQLLILLNLRQHLPPVHPGHIQVQQNHVRAG